MIRNQQGLEAKLSCCNVGLKVTVLSAADGNDAVVVATVTSPILVCEFPEEISTSDPFIFRALDKLTFRDTS
jgi:hypothetical protein